MLDPLPKASITFFCGLAAVPTADLLEDAIRAADGALYAAKHAG
jgi:PleD family two-component response regulator